MAITLGTDSGFVTVAPTADPVGSSASVIDGSSIVTKDVSPVGAVAITEIGWWRDAGTDGANFELGLYSEAAGVADALLEVERTNSSTSTGWIRKAVNWAISPSTAYWLGLQMDAHTGSSSVDIQSSGGIGRDLQATQTTLTDPYGGGAVANAVSMAAIYALVAFSGADSKQKHCFLTLNNWMAISIPISSDGIDASDKRQLMRGFPSQTYSSTLSGDSGDSEWVHRHRRRGRR